MNINREIGMHGLICTILALFAGLGGCGIIENYYFITIPVIILVFLFFLLNKFRVKSLSLISTWMILVIAIISTQLFVYEQDWGHILLFIIIISSPIMLASGNWNNYDLGKVCFVISLSSLIALFTNGPFSKEYISGRAYSGRLWPLYYFSFAMIGYLLAKEKNKKGIFWLSTMFMNFYSIMLSRSRISLVCVIMMLFLFLIVNKNRSYKCRRVISISIILLIILTPCFYNYLYSNPNNSLEKIVLDVTGKKLFTGREALWLVVWNEAKNKVKFGSGGLPGSFYWAGALRSSHNLFFELIYRYGLIVCILYLLFLLNQFKLVYHNKDDNISLLCLCSYWGILIQQSFEVSLFSPVSFILPALLLGIAMGRDYSA